MKSVLNHPCEIAELRVTTWRLNRYSPYCCRNPQLTPIHHHAEKNPDCWMRFVHVNFVQGLCIVYFVANGLSNQLSIRFGIEWDAIVSHMKPHTPSRTSESRGYFRTRRALTKSRYAGLKFGYPREQASKSKEIRLCLGLWSESIRHIFVIMTKS